MGEARRRKDRRAQNWPEGGSALEAIDLYVLPPAAAIDGKRLRDLTGDTCIPEDSHVVLRTFKAIVGDRDFNVGFCLGDGDQFSAIGLAVIERLTMEVPCAPLHIVPVKFEDIAWDIVLRHLRTFTGKLLLFAFPNSDVYDAGTAEIHYSKEVRQFDIRGTELPRMTTAQRAEIWARKAQLLNRPPPSKFYPSAGVRTEDGQWIFRIKTPTGKVIRTAVWDGRRDYAHELPKDILSWVGGKKIAIVQVASPVGVNRRSSLLLTHTLAQDFDAVVHWARDTETFQSILRSFIRLDLESVGPPTLPADWTPEIMILAANG